MVERNRLWLETALRWQSALSTFVVAGFCVGAAAGLRAGLMLQMVVLLVGIITIGFPHGAFDYLVAKPVLLKRLGRTWFAVFLTAYLGLAGLVWLAWIAAPAVTLAGFLAATVVHFGLGDTEHEPLGGRNRVGPPCSPWEACPYFYPSRFMRVMRRRSWPQWAMLRLPRCARFFQMPSGWCPFGRWRSFGARLLDGAAATVCRAALSPLPDSSCCRRFSLSVCILGSRTRPSICFA